MLKITDECAIDRSEVLFITRLPAIFIVLYWLLIRGYCSRVGSSRLPLGLLPTATNVIAGCYRRTLKSKSVNGSNGTSGLIRIILDASVDIFVVKQDL